MGNPYETEILLRATAPSNDTSAPPRIAVVMAHPDDESLAIGGRMGRYRDAVFIHITDGAPANGADARAHGFPSLESYREARALELHNALRQAGIVHPHLYSLNIPDQEAGLNLLRITAYLASVFADLAPEAVLTHPYEGGHPDHDACAFAVHHAVAFNARAGHRPPVVFEAPFYHTGRNGGMETGCFLPPCSGRPPNEVIYGLSPAEADRKRAILACFKSQRDTLHAFPFNQERFRLAPYYDFTRPPHDRPFLYDQFKWGIDGASFLKHAAGATAQLVHEAQLALEAQLAPEAALCH